MAACRRVLARAMRDGRYIAEKSCIVEVVNALLGSRYFCAWTDMHFFSSHQREATLPQEIDPLVQTSSHLPLTVDSGSSQ